MVIEGGPKNHEKKLVRIKKELLWLKTRNLGDLFQISSTDERWETGELVGVNKDVLGITNKNGKLNGYIQAKDSEGRFFRVKSGDERWETGEIVGVNKGIPAPQSVVMAARARKGIPKTKEHNEKVSESMKKLKWYANLETGQIKRCQEGYQPIGFIRVTGPHKKEVI